MKKHGGLILTLSATLLGIVVLLNTQPVSAEACSNVDNFGAVEMALPVLPQAESHAIWIRMQGPSTSAKVLAEINKSNCIEVSGSNMTANQWSWQTYRQNGALKTLKFPSLEGNNLSIVGIEPGVKVDRVLITRSDCVPHEFGDNCSDAAEALNTSGDSTTTIMLPPPSNDAVSGKVVLSASPENYESSLKSLSYSVGGKILQTSDQNEPFDTTLLANGKHTVTITTMLTEGTIIREQTVIDVDNDENAFSPIVRWLRLNLSSIKVIGLVFASIAAVVAVYILLKRWYLRYLDRSLHGL